MRTPTLWLALLTALGTACNGPQPPGPRPPSPPPRPRPPSAITTVDALAADLARKLGPAPRCLVATELLGPRYGGYERSDFGANFFHEFNSRLREKAPHIRTSVLKGAPRDSAAWVEGLSLQKADAVIEGTYQLDEENHTFALTIEVSRRTEAVLASTHGRIRATKAMVADAKRRLTVLKPGTKDRVWISREELKLELYDLPSTAADIKVGIRPVRKVVPFDQNIEFEVHSNVNGYLTILYHGASGALDFLIPNPRLPVLTVRKGEKLMVPPAEPVNGWITKLPAGPPAGWERVKAIVSRQRIPWPIDAKGNVPTDTVARLRAVREILRDSRFGEGHCELQTVAR